MLYASLNLINTEKNNKLKKLDFYSFFAMLYCKEVVMRVSKDKITYVCKWLFSYMNGPLQENSKWTNFTSTFKVINVHVTCSHA